MIAQLTRFRALKQAFRGLFDGHTPAVGAVAALVDRRITITPRKVYAANLTGEQHAEGMLPCGLMHNHNENAN